MIFRTFFTRRTFRTFANCRNICSYASVALVGFVGAMSAVSLTAATPAFARDCTIAETVFTDGLYGMGAGLIVGALWMTADAKHTTGDTVVPTLATAALIGGGIGGVLGVVEVGLCINDRKAAAPKLGFQMPEPTLLVAQKNASEDAGLGLRFRYNFR